MSEVADPSQPCDELCHCRLLCSCCGACTQGHGKPCGSVLIKHRDKALVRIVMILGQLRFWGQIRVRQPVYMAGLFQNNVVAMERRYAASLVIITYSNITL